MVATTDKGKAPESSLTTSQSLVSFQSLYESLDLPTSPSSLSPESVLRIALTRLEQLKSPGEPFTKQSAASKKAVEAGKVKALNGEEITLKPGEKDLVLKISSRFDLDECTSFLLLRTFLRSDEAASLSLPSAPTSSSALDASTSQSSSLSKATLADDLLDHFNLFFFRERLALLKLVSALLRAYEDESHDYFSVALEIIPLLLNLPTASSLPSSTSPPFSESLFRQFITLARTPLPSNIASSERHAPLWAKQSLKEQLALLEIVFLVLYSPMPADAGTAEGIIMASVASGFGREQANGRLVGSDEEGREMLRSIEGMLVLICVEVLSLESLLSCSTNAALSNVFSPTLSQSAEPPTPIILSSPKHLLSLHSFFSSLLASPSTPALSPVLLAWSYVVSRLTDYLTEETPESYIPLADAILPSASPSDGSLTAPVWQTCVSAAVGSQGGLFEYLKVVMEGPLFVDVETKNGAMPADLNSLGYRSVFKGLILSLNELVRVEFLPFQPLLDVWIALFGAGTGSSSLCTQFWRDDYPLSASRRSLLSLARSRFPILFRPLTQLLRSLTGSSISHPSSSTFSPSEDLSQADIDQSSTCAHIVFSFLSTLPTFPYVLPPNTRGLFVAEQGMEEGEMQFRSLKRLVFPGGVVVPVGSVGRVISPPRVSPVVVSWNVEVSGWKMALEVLRSFIGENPRRRAVAKKSRMAGDDVFGAAKGVSRPGEEELRLEIEDLGMGDIGEEAVLDILHLFGSLLSSGPDLAAHLIDHLSIESASDETDPPSDLVQILFTILEQSLTSSSRPNSKLVSVTLGLLTSLLPAFPGRVWTYLRSSSLLFSNGRRSASTASVLASERSIGTYGMTIALLDLIFALFLEAQRTHFVAEPDFLKVKADVLSRALGLIHAEVWSGYTGWKYTSLRERFDIGRKITILYDEILKDPTLAPSSPSDASLGPLSILQTFLAEAFILNTTSLTLSPIVSTLVIGRGLVSGLYASGRVFEAPKAERLIEVTLRLARHVLALKRRLNVTRIVALEQLFFDRSSTSRTAGSRQLKAEIVDVVANFVVSPTSSLGIASEAVRLLSTLCGSLSTATSDTPPSIVGHLDDAVATTKAFLSVLGDPYQDRDLRRSIWNLLGVLVSTQIGWAALFIDLDHQGKLMSSLPLSGKGKKKETDQKDETNAIGLAQQMISIWSELWDSDPALLSSILRFVDLAWQHFPDHSSLATLRSDPAFWEKVFALALRSKLTPSEIDLSDEAFTSGPVPQDVDEDEAERDVRAISYRNLSRAHAIHLFALDLEIMGRRTGGKAGKDRKPEQASFAIIEKLLLRQKHRLLGGATLRYLRNSCDPELHEEVHKSISDAYPGLLVEKVRVKLPLEEREFGHDYLYSTDILRQKLEGFRSDAVDTALIDGTIGAVESINLDWSLIDSESSCTKAWRQFLAAAVPLILDSSPNLAEILLQDVRTIAPVIADESRPGDVVLAVHGERMEILRCLVQGTWGSSVMEGASLAKSASAAPTSSSADTVPQIESFIGSLPFIQALITSETFPPLDSLLGASSIPFHQTLLQILFLYVRKAIGVPPHSSAPSYISAQQRYILHTFLQTTLKFLVTALAATFERILQTRDPTLDNQLGFLISVFEQAIRVEHQLSPTEWLALADELGLFRLSLDLLASAPWASPPPGDEEMGESSPSTPRRPLFVENILNLHLAVSMLDRGAERLVVSGIMAAYSSNIVAAQAETGAISSVLKEPFGMGVDPVHASWLIMLSVVVNLIGSIGSSTQFVETEIVPWVQLCGSQLTRSLAPNASQPITSLRLHELSLISTLFLSIATSLTSSPTVSRRPKSIPVLRAFADRAVFLVAWINDLLAHPNFLSSSIEPVSEDERWMLSKESATDDSAREAAGSDSEPSGFVDDKKRPLLASFMQKLILLSRTILFALNLASHSSTILSTDPSVWPPENLIIMPDSKVSTTEPASLGTLLELGNLMTDWHRTLVSSPPSLAPTAAGDRSKAPSSEKSDKVTLLYLPEFSSSTCITATRHSLEAISLLSSTQLVLAASIKLSSLPPLPVTDSTMSLDSDLDSRSVRKSRSTSGPSYDERESVLERFRELAQDTQRMMKVGTAKTEVEEGEGEILGVLASFLERELLS